MIRDPSILETPEAPALKGGAIGTVFSMLRQRRDRRRKRIPSTVSPLSLFSIPEKEEPT
jgi:hypothetical protein